MRIGIDVGGTKMEAIALHGAGHVLDRRRITAPRGHYVDTLGAICNLVTVVERDLGRRGTVGVCMPGALSPASGLIKNANSTWLIGQPFDRDLSAALGRPVRVMNDANCFALSEATDGAAADACVVFGVILGTGVGGGVVIDRRVLIGRNAISGEWGHNPLPWPDDGERPGPCCYCGKRGCIEAFLSGPGLARDYEAAGGRPGTAQEVVAAAAAGHPTASAAVERYQDRLARALALVLNILDPDVVVLGGGLSNARSLFEGLPKRLADYVFSDRVDTPIVPARHGDSSGVRGAAWLWTAEHGEDPSIEQGSATL